MICVTTLRIDITSAPPKPDTLPGIEIAGMQDAMKPQFQTSAGDRQFADRLALLCELPLQMSADTPLDSLFETILARLVQVIPGAQRAAFLMCDPVSGELLPRAYVSPGGAGPAVSETLARRSIEEGKGFLWLRSQAGEASESILINRIESGMYAPLVWMDKAIGVLCVDHPQARTPFSNADLSFLVAVAQYAAMAVTNHNLAEDLRRTVRIQERLLTNFSPKLRQKLLDRARHGRLRAGGERSEVTILSCDMR